MTSTFFHDFQQFVFSNNVIEAAAGLCIGMYTKEMLVTFLEKLVYPVLLWLAKLTMLHGAWFSLAAKSKSNVMGAIATLSWTAFEYALFVVLTFFILEYIINRRIIGLKTLVAKNARADFEESKCRHNVKHDHPRRPWSVAGIPHAPVPRGAFSGPPR